jgi:MEMO1 family protein
VAGRFYPHDRTELAALVRRFVDRPPTEAAAPPKAIVVPHAGYVFSGQVAGRAYAELRPLAGVVERVILAGPSHFVPFTGVATSGADAFATPLGPVPIDADARDVALAVTGVIVDDEAHRDEHSLEVQLPFLQVILGTFRLLPVLTGSAAPPVLTRLLDELWGGRETVIVISTDLSHYHDDVTARRLDKTTARAVVEGRDGDLRDADACGANGLRGLVVAARAHGLRTTLLDLATSADTIGRPDRVVGYGAFSCQAG